MANNQVFLFMFIIVSEAYVTPGSKKTSHITKRKKNIYISKMLNEKR